MKPEEAEFEPVSGLGMLWEALRALRQSGFVDEAAVFKESSKFVAEGEADSQLLEAALYLRHALEVIESQARTIEGLSAEVEALRSGGRAET